jgi:predicted adenine nucleotide alpha hydrolase (AANH) superfamily ATPase
MACLYGGEIGLEQAFRHHPLLEGHGSPKSFSDAAFEKELRCPRCYLFRLEKTAARAQAEGYGAFSTTLLISPYQQHDLIRRLGEELGAHYRVEFLYRDFRPRFRSGQEAARQRGCYIQKYCGCVFSEEERYRKTPQKAGLPREAADSE